MTDIRPAQPHDATALVPLMQTYYAGSPVPLTVDPVAMREHLIAMSKPNPIGGLLVATQGPQPVGFALLYFGFSTRALRRTVTLNDLFVAPSVRRQGIARLLMQATFDWAQAQDCVAVDWVTRTSNATAQHLYEQVGTRESGWLHYQHVL
ncbi:GNAT family N-acetyltransferase [Lacticaseibacillus daqingensis]|uniref:GNAT family N-acetyltransferase n=1 Tax=Lacticaseibacillus daqingensis TaxID=2486014 RepID=UPI000F7A861C|nr:GNAT family N-acetyltransferase [Lacticaseibacillus daqingensis]